MYSSRVRHERKEREEKTAARRKDRVEDGYTQEISGTTGVQTTHGTRNGNMKKNATGSGRKEKMGTEVPNPHAHNSLPSFV